MKAVFFGTPQIAATVLDYLATKPIEILAVVTNPDRPVKRSKKPLPSPVKESAEKLGLPIYQPEKASSEEFVSLLQGLKADIFIVVAYGEIFKENFLAVPPKGCINMHASILPKYRGAAPINWAIWRGEKESGVSIMKIAKKMDAGGVYKVVKTPITEEMTAGELTEKLAEIGKEALFETLVEIEEGRATLTTQDEALVTSAPKLQAKDGLIDFTKSAEESYNQIRACTPKPGAFCFVESKGVKKRLKIIRAEKKLNVAGNIGEILVSDNKTLLVACKSGALALLVVQPESKKEMTIKEFLHGTAKTNLKF